MRATRGAVPALLGSGRTWHAAIGMAAARQPAGPSAPFLAVGSDEGSSGYRVSGIKNPCAETQGENRLRVIQAVGYRSEVPGVTEGSDTKKQTNLHKGNAKLGRMYTYGERLRWAMAQAKPPMSGRALALRIGIRPQSVHYLLDPSRNAKGSRHTTAIARALGVSADWLETGRGKPHKTNGRHHPDQRESIASCIRTAQLLLLELERLARLLDERG